MLLESKLEKFIIKRALIIFIILSIISSVLAKEKWFSLAGLALGSVFSFIRLKALESALSGILISRARLSASAFMAIKYAVNQIALIFLLFVSVKYNIWFFIGMTAGILLVPLTILLNGICAGFSIMHNNIE